MKNTLLAVSSVAEAIDGGRVYAHHSFATTHLGVMQILTGQPGRNPDGHRMRMVRIAPPTDGSGVASSAEKISGTPATSKTADK